MGLPAIQVLLLLNVLVFLAQMAFPQELILNFALWPPGPLFQAWQVVTYAFLHGSVMHIAFNMLGLVVFGSDLERLFGAGRFVRLYFAAVFTAAVAQLIVTGLSASQDPTVGASGGVFGLLLVYALLFPDRRLFLLFPPIPVRARVFAIGYAVLELFLGITQTAQGIAHFAHLGGMVGGYLFYLTLKQRY